MPIKINAMAEFERADGTMFKLDAYELNEFVRGLYDAKGLETKGPDGQTKKTLTYALIVPEVKAMAKEKAGVDLSTGEAIAVFDSAPHAWESVQKNWLPPTEALPTSPPSTDPRYAPE